MVNSQEIVAFVFLAYLALPVLFYFLWVLWRKVRRRQSQEPEGEGETV